MPLAEGKKESRPTGGSKRNKWAVARATRGEVTQSGIWGPPHSQSFDRAHEGNMNRPITGAVGRDRSCAFRRSRSGRTAMLATGYGPLPESGGGCRSLLFNGFKPLGKNFRLLLRQLNDLPRLGVAITKVVPEARADVTVAARPCCVLANFDGGDPRSDPVGHSIQFIEARQPAQRVEGAGREACLWLDTCANGADVGLEIFDAPLGRRI